MTREVDGSPLNLMTFKKSITLLNRNSNIYIEEPIVMCFPIILILL